MGSTSKSDGEAAVEMEMDGSGQSIQLEEEWKERKGGEIGVLGEMLTLLGSGSSSAAAERQMEELAASIKTLSLMDGPVSAELISKLEDYRVQSSEEKRLARKAVWIEEARREVSSRGSFRNSNCLTAVLPDELAWKGILSNLEDPKDKALMSRMSLLWRDLLKAERTTYLFDMVFPLLYPLLAFSKKDIYNLRAVSNHWKRFLESYLQSMCAFNTHTDLKGIRDVSRHPSASSLWTVFRSGDSRSVREFVEKALKTYGVGSNGNPIIFSKLILGVPYHITDLRLHHARNMYWNEVVNLLQHWGEQLLAIQIVLDADTDITEIYDGLHNLLQLLPNLRYLSLEAYEGGQIHRGGTKKLLQDIVLGRRVAENPLPDLPHLTSFTAHEIPVPLVSAVLNKCSSTLENVAIAEMFGTANACGGYGRLPQLKQFLHCTKYPSLTDDDDESRLTVLDWPSLEQSCLAYDNLEAAGIPRLFQRLNQFGGTLRGLTLVLKKDDGQMAKLSERALKMLSLELPHLEDFCLLVYRINLKTVDFILPMTSLKKLTVVYEKQVSSFQNKKPQADEVKAGTSKSLSGTVKVNADIASGEIIKFGEYTNRLYESNIWKLLPELKKVVIGVIVKLKEERGRRTAHVDEDAKPKQVKKKVYTREGYKEHCSSGCPI